MAKNSEMDRREFLSRTAIVAASAAFVSACAGSITGAPTNIDGTVTIADHPALANVDGVALVSISGSPIAIVRTGTSSFVALSRICPHQGNTINQNGSDGFICTGHQAMFTLNGTWKGGQPTSNMRSYPVTFDQAAGTLKLG